ncbi:Ribosome association toxin RatA [Photobacterium malacitanum]|uniref:Ribosome association toxin RatA n=1 Tax=Photobacterium malacitanum TaxID=2204294 RepID=A0A1Y6MNV2_9GAMM|nr:SRPBCC family protein [Photobacterium malacitanum]SMY37498.1 Ribosome association toxin RatA [Photobacterium malacitanum]
MPQISRSALVPFSAQQMFNLVNDVESYPMFLPGCAGSKIIESSTSHMMASVDVAKAGIRKTFVTHNKLVDFNQIQMQLVDGPFRKLVGGWTFTELDATACKIELNLEFEFTSALIDVAFGKIFRDLTSNMVQAFTQRAREVYAF